MSTLVRSLFIAICFVVRLCPANAQTSVESFAHVDLTIDARKGIDERGYRDVNGVQQFVMIRGVDRDNPVLLYLHGGPGAAASLYAWKFFARGGWERSFTVVHWDQPGAGKTFARAGAIDPALTLERIVEDGVAVAESVARQLGKKKIVLVGGSWGSVIGVKMAKARPDLFYAYVGTAQVVSTPDDELLAYQQVLAKARRSSDQKAIDELQRAGAPPYASVGPFRTQRKWASTYEHLPRVNIQEEAASTPGTTSSDLQTWWSGFQASDLHFRGADMKGVSATVDVRTWGPEFAVPVFFLQGTDDDITPMSQVKMYFDWIKAPRKQLLPIEGAGHNASTSRSADFVKLLETHVRPLAMQP